MSNLIPMSGYPVPVRPYSQITPFTYRDNSTYLEILEQIRTWIQNTLVPHLDSEYEELVQSWADNIELLTTQYQTLLDSQTETLREEFVTADDALGSRIDSLTATVASNDASVRSAFAAADAALQAQINTINSNVAAMNTSIRADFAAADAVLQTNIDTVDTDTNARIDDIIANSVSAQDSVVAGLVNSNTSLTNTALDAKYATDADMNAANAHLTSVDGNITSLTGRMTTAEGTITSHTNSIATNASAISTTNTNLATTNTNLGTTNSNVSALTTRVTNAEGNITTNTSDINSFKAAAPRTVASASARDALFPSPVQGNSVFRSDLGYEERYYAAYNSSTNPGGRTPAGWYAGQDGGLVPIVPTSVAVGSGSASVSATGLVTFTGASSVQLNSVFTTNFSRYRFVIMYTGGNGSSALNMRLTDSSASAFTSNSYQWYGALIDYANLSRLGGSGQTQVQISPITSAGSVFCDMGFASGVAYPYATMSSAYNNGSTLVNWWFNSNAVAGMTVFPSAGSFTGTIQVYGYRN